MEYDRTLGFGADLEHLASQLGRALAQLDQAELRMSRPQMTPGETVFRDPYNTYHHITIGAVLASYDVDAHHARRLDGLLAMNADQFREMIDRLPDGGEDEDEDEEDNPTVGQMLLQLMTEADGPLENFGRYAEWRRAFDRYMTPTARFLSGMTAEDLAKLEGRPPTRAQLNLVRTTCEYHRLAFPELPNRAAAFRWLRDAGANARYREPRL